MGQFWLKKNTAPGQFSFSGTMPGAAYVAQDGGVRSVVSRQEAKEVAKGNHYLQHLHFQIEENLFS